MKKIFEDPSEVVFLGKQLLCSGQSTQLPSMHPRFGLHTWGHALVSNLVNGLNPGVSES